MSKFCANCGAQLSDGDNFCASCGTKLEPTAEPTAEPVIEEAVNPADEPISEPAAEQVPESSAEPEPATIEQPVEETAEQPAADEKNLYNTPRSDEPSPFVAYTPNNTKTPEPVPSNTTYAETTFNPEPAKKSGKGAFIAILTIILVLLIGAGVAIYIIFFSSGIFSSGNWKEAVEAYYDAQEEPEFEDFRKAIGDTALIAIVEKENGSDIQTFKLGCQRMQKICREMNVDVDIDYEILDVQKMSEDDLENYNENTLIAQEGYEVDVSYTVKNEITGEKEDHSNTLTVVMFDGDWCVTDIVDDIDNVIEFGELSDDEFETALDYYKDY